MHPYSPASPRERLALGLFSAVVSLALMASVLVLFNDRGLPWSPHLAKGLQTNPVGVASAPLAPAAQAVPQAPSPTRPPTAFAVTAAAAR